MLPRPLREGPPPAWHLLRRRAAGTAAQGCHPLSQLPPNEVRPLSAGLGDLQTGARSCAVQPASWQIVHWACTPSSYAAGTPALPSSTHRAAVHCIGYHPACWAVCSKAVSYSLCGRPRTFRLQRGCWLTSTGDPAGVKSGPPPVCRNCGVTSTPQWRIGPGELLSHLAGPLAPWCLGKHACSCCAIALHAVLSSAVLASCALG